MSEAIEVPQKNVDPERYKQGIIILTVFTTVLAAVLAALQVDAGIREDIANRESQYLAVLASGELHRAGLAGDYEFTIFGDYLTNLQETTVLELTALEQKEAGDTRAADSTGDLAAVAQARAEVGERFSVFYNDPRYAPQAEDGLPAADQYLIDLHQPAGPRRRRGGPQRARPLDDPRPRRADGLALRLHHRRLPPNPENAETIATDLCACRSTARRGSQPIVAIALRGDGWPAGHNDGDRAQRGCGHGRGRAAARRLTTEGETYDLDTPVRGRRLRSCVVVRAPVARRAQPSASIIVSAARI